MSVSSNVLLRFCFHVWGILNSSIVTLSGFKVIQLQWVNLESSPAPFIILDTCWIVYLEPVFTLLKILIAYWLCVCVCIRRIREVAKTHKVVEQELAHAVNASAAVLSEAFPSKPSSPEVHTHFSHDTTLYTPWGCVCGWWSGFPPQPMPPKPDRLFPELGRGVKESKCWRRSFIGVF